MSINFPTEIIVTEQTINLRGLSQKQKDFFIDFAKKLVEIYSSRNKDRLVVGLAGSPGTGKSVLAAIVEKIIPQLTTDFSFFNNGIDAYHFRNNYLSTHFDKETPLKTFKGRYDTYDLSKLGKDISEFKKGDETKFPIYSRKLHEPVEDKVVVNEHKALLLLEGQWACHTEHGWSKIFEKMDYLYFIESTTNRAKENVIKRHVRGGRNQEDAVRQYNNNDLVNAKMVAQDITNADEILRPYYSL